MLRCCSAILLELCPKMLCPQKHQDFKWVLASCVGSIRGQVPGSKQTWALSWSMSRYLEATALLLGAKLGDLEGKLGCREVMLTLSASKNVLPQAGPRF